MEHSKSKHYFLAPLELKDTGEFKLFLPKALISTQGVYQIFGNSEYAQRAFLEARIFQVNIDGHDCLARLVREKGMDGSHFNLRFLKREKENHDRIHELMNRQGFESPWRRKYPRLHSVGVPQNVESPISAIFPRTIGQTVAEVLNFSLHGMLFEFLSTGSSLGEYVGQKVHFHLITNQGTQLSDIEGRVARIYDEMVAPGKLIRALGIKFTKMPKDSDDKYKDIILDVCENIKRSS